MGTNFYARIIPSKERKKELIDAVERNDFKEVNRLSQELYGSFDKWDRVGGEVHLGKRSGGWKFLWNPNWYEERHGHTEWEEVEEGHKIGRFVSEPSTVFKFYDLTKKSIKEFIDREDVEIYDEYGDKQDKEEFFFTAINWTTWTDPKTGKVKEAWDGESYEEWEKENNPNRRIYDYSDSEYCKFLKEQGIEINKYGMDFYSDGLRFSTSVEFS